MVGNGAVLFYWDLKSFFIIRRHQLAALIAQSAASVGAVLALICLITGALWGRPTWGTYWIWDARLTSMLILFFIYLAYIIIHKTIDDSHRAAKISSVFALIGLVDLPIIKFSVEWWSTLHQGPSVIRAGGSAIHASMLTPLLISALGMACLAGGIICMNSLSSLMALKIKRHYQRQVLNG